MRGRAPGVPPKLEAIWQLERQVGERNARVDMDMAAAKKIEPSSQLQARILARNRNDPKA